VKENVYRALFHYLENSWEGEKGGANLCRKHAPPPQQGEITAHWLPPHFCKPERFPHITRVGAKCRCSGLVQVQPTS